MQNIKLPPLLATRCDAFLVSIAGYAVPSSDWVLPQSVRRQFEAYRNREDCQRFIVGRHALWRVLGCSEPFGCWLNRWATDSHGRPSVSGGPCFSLSHSGDYVAVAVSALPVGIDIESVRPINIDDFNIVLNQIDLGQIRESANPINKFFDLWTGKEAVAKALGVGLNSDSAFIGPPIGGKVWYECRVWDVYTCVEISGYSLSVALVSR